MCNCGGNMVILFVLIVFVESQREKFFTSTSLESKAKGLFLFTHVKTSSMPVWCLKFCEKFSLSLSSVTRSCFVVRMLRVQWNFKANKKKDHGKLAS